ncbi:MAG TPA: YceI family protein [Gemmatimonadales bacterium]|jgi:polyisoprenoid-binding protein YceI|nr:YceI family protein [Gemmatimonadales bacterium]
MMNRQLTFLIATSFTLLASAAHAQAAVSADSGVYQLAPQSRLDVYTGKSGLFSFVGHKHQIRARQFSGTIVYFPGDPSRSRLAITVATRGLEVLTPPDTEEIRKVTESMRGEVMHVDSFPEITFISKQVTPIRGGFRVNGALTMHGQTRFVPVDFMVESRVDTLRARATFEVKQTDFGIRPFRGGPGGAVHVADEVKFDIDAVAVRKP